MEMTFDHHRMDGIIALPDLLKHGIEHRGLPIGVLLTVCMTAIDHEGGRQTSLLKALPGLSHDIGCIIRPATAPPQYELTIRIAFGGHCRGTPIIRNAEKCLRLGGGNNSIDPGFKISTGCIFKAHWHGKSRSHLPVRLRLRCPRPNGRPAE